MDKIDFKYLMSYRNINGEIYHCDVDRFLGGNVSLDQRDEVHSALMEIVKERNRNEKEI